MDPVEELQQRITTSIQHLNSRIEASEQGINDYQRLKETLSTYPHEISRNVDIDLGPKAFIRGKVVHTNEILVLLGDNWFVERSAHQSLEIIDRRIASLDKNIALIKERLESANRALDSLTRIKDEEPISSELEPQLEIPSDQLQMMDIREELDDEGNVISSSVQPQRTAEFQAFAEKQLKKLMDTKEESGDTQDLTKIKELLYSNPYEEESTKDTGIQEKQSKKSEQSKQSGLKSTDGSLGGIVESPQDKSTSNRSGPAEQASPVKASSLTTPPIQSEPPLNTALTSKQNLRTTSTAVQHSLPSSNHSFTPTSIPVEELLELELIANDLDGEDVEYSDLDVDADWDDDDDDDDVDDEDEYGRTRGSLFPFKPPPGLASQLTGIARPTELIGSHQSESDIKKVRFDSVVDVKTFTKPPLDDKKQVRFSSEVNIQSYTPLPEDPEQELQQEESKQPKISRFKADRMRGSRSQTKKSSSPNVLTPAGRVSDIFERPSQALNSHVEKPQDIKPTPLQTPKTSHVRPEETISDKQPKFTPDVLDLANKLFSDAVVTKEQFLMAHDDTSDTSNTVQQIDQKSSHLDRPVVADTVVEKDPSVISNNMDLEEEEEPQTREIAQEYQRLRRKLIDQSGGFSKTDQESMYEPIDEDGNKVKVSRFRAARLSNRRE